MKNNAIEATREAFNWTELADNGFPMKALTSAAQLSNGGSGNMAVFSILGETYWSFLTAGHCLSMFEKGYQIDDRSFAITRDESLPTPGKLSLTNKEFGLSWCLNDHQDVGVIITHVNAGTSTGKIIRGFNSSSAVTFDDIFWENSLPSSGRYDAVFFPGTVLTPSVIDRGNLVRSGDGFATIGNAIGNPGTSGGGVFWSSESSNPKYIGPVRGGVADSRTGICVIANSLGKDGFVNLLEQAAADLQRKS